MTCDIVYNLGVEVVINASESKVFKVNHQQPNKEVEGHMADEVMLARTSLMATEI